MYNEWAAVTKGLKYQPLDYIKEYFGVKIALYFAWLGFYTFMLIPASIVGLACFIYSCLTLYENQPRLVAVFLLLSRKLNKNYLQKFFLF